MAKARWAPRGPQKSEIMNIRVQPLTKQELKRAAKASGRTMSAEAEFQLHRALFEMSGPLWPILKAVSAALNSVSTELGKATRWAEDPALFDRAAAMINAALEMFRPQGSVRRDATDDERHQVRTVMIDLLDKLSKADPSVPLAKQSLEQRRLVKLKEDLGTVGAEPVLQQFTELALKTRTVEKPLWADAERLWQATRLLMEARGCPGKASSAMMTRRSGLSTRRGKRNERTHPPSRHTFLGIEIRHWRRSASPANAVSAMPASRAAKREAELELARLVAQNSVGEGIDPSKATVAEFLERWDRDWASINVGGKTLDATAKSFKLNVVPHIGAVRIQKLRPVHLNELYTKLQRSGGQGGRPLSARSVGHVHRLLHRALGHAATWGVTAQNVAALVGPPPVPHSEITILTEEQIGATLRHLQGRTLRPIVSFLLDRAPDAARRWRCVGKTSASIRAWFGSSVRSNRQRPG